jgi:Protein of unknown function (DUF3455)
MTLRRSILYVVLLAPLLGTGALVKAAGGAPADVPEPIRVPPGENLLLVAHASGVQIYTCTVANGAPQWTLKAPEAELKNAQGAVVIHHSAGPTWKHQDGSQITGKTAAHADAPDAHSIPWLLVAVVGHSGSGKLAQVTHVQRIHTHGGQAPPAAQCDAARQGTEARIAYSADYLFYTPTAR